MSKEPKKWEVIEHSWSDTSIVCGDRTILTKSIYDEATEENQEELEDQVIQDFNLIIKAVNNHDKLVEERRGLELEVERLMVENGRIYKALGKIIDAQDNPEKTLATMNAEIHNSKQLLTELKQQ